MRRLLCCLFVVSGCFGCAQRQNLPPGDDLEHAEVHAEQAGGGQSAIPKASDAELATAWEPPPPPAPPKPLEALPDDEQSAERTLSAQAEAENRAKLKDLLVAGRKALGAQKLEEAQTDAEEALRVAEGLSPAEQQQASELAFKVAHASADLPGALKAAEQWLKRCGPEKIGACRGKALNAWSSVGRLKGAAAGSINEKVKQIFEADACLGQGEAKREVPACLGEAAALYRRQKDRLMVARVSWLKAVAALAEKKTLGEVEPLLRRAEVDCTELRCSAIRRKALKTLSSLRYGSGDVEGATAASLKEMRIASSLLPADQRPYARSGEVDKLCAAYDARAGAGSCRKLEKKLNGDWSFRDFSAGRKVAALAGDNVKSVNEHFNCLLQECLALEADRLTPPQSVTYEVLWAVTNDGRVAEVRMGRKDQEEGPMLQCLKKQFVLWRYPKYQGELQHVAQRFTVSAHERRTR